jgi:hypothetical protein
LAVAARTGEERGVQWVSGSTIIDPTRLPAGAHRPVGRRTGAAGPMSAGGRPDEAPWGEQRRLQ